eukprot:1161583-Pelagomonas_calceolata.AAC.9
MHQGTATTAKGGGRTLFTQAVAVMLMRFKTLAMVLAWNVVVVHAWAVAVTHAWAAAVTRAWAAAVTRAWAVAVMPAGAVSTVGQLRHHTFICQALGVAATVLGSNASCLLTLHCKQKRPPVCLPSYLAARLPGVGFADARIQQQHPMRGAHSPTIVLCLRSARPKARLPLSFPLHHQLPHWSILSATNHLDKVVVQVGQYHPSPLIIVSQVLCSQVRCCLFHNPFTSLKPSLANTILHRSPYCDPGSMRPSPLLPLL